MEVSDFFKTILEVFVEAANVPVLSRGIFTGKQLLQTAWI
jgi:hypothetical protein